MLPSDKKVYDPWFTATSVGDFFVFKACSETC